VPSRHRLYVLRHAKSSWDEPGLDDHERPLAPRGRRAVKLIAEYVREHEIAPALVLCSTARRAQETLEAVHPTGEVLIEREIYGASCSELIERLRQVPEATPSVMLIGHNPALQVLVLRLAMPPAGTNGRTAASRGATETDLDHIERKFPTGALAELSFACGWDALGPGRARLDAYVRPKQLY
jgi:phosphohistidine phosphatase